MLQRVGLVIEIIVVIGHILADVIIDGFDLIIVEVAIHIQLRKEGTHGLRHGFEFDMDTAKYKNGKLIAVYLKGELGGFAVHLVQK